MDEKLNPTDVVAWMREQARRFTEMAEQIEATFSLNGRERASLAPTPQKESVQDRMTELLKDGRSRRALTIAQEIRATEAEVNEVVSEASDIFSRNERGWICHTLRHSLERG